MVYFRMCNMMKRFLEKLNDIPQNAYCKCVWIVITRCQYKSSRGFPQGLEEGLLVLDFKYWALITSYHWNTSLFKYLESYVIACLIGSRQQSTRDDGRYASFVRWSQRTISVSHLYSIHQTVSHKCDPGTLTPSERQDGVVHLQNL